MVMAKTNTSIRYRGGYRYQLIEHYTAQTSILGFEAIGGRFVFLQVDGVLRFKRDYCWDGASLAIDTKDIIRPSLIHDALYQLSRDHNFGSQFRKLADLELYHACRDDGMSWIRAGYVYLAVRLFGAASANPKNKRTVQVAP